METKKPKAIFFDWFGTLCDSGILDHLSNKSHPLHSHQKLIRDFLYLNKKGATEDLLLGNITMLNYCNEIAKRIGVSDHQIMSEFATSFSNFKWADPLIPGYIQAIRAKGIKVVLIANASVAFRKYTVSALELDKYFDAILLSCELKVFKYDTSLEDLLFFEGFLKSHKINYEECFVLDDRPEEKILRIMDVPYEVVSDVGTLKAIMKKYI